MVRSKKKYGLGLLLVDLLLTLITGGLWLFVIVIQFLRRNS